MTAPIGLMSWLEESRKPWDIVLTTTKECVAARVGQPGHAGRKAYSNFEKATLLFGGES